MTIQLPELLLSPLHPRRKSLNSCALVAASIPTGAPGATLDLSLKLRNFLAELRVLTLQARHASSSSIAPVALLMHLIMVHPSLECQIDTVGGIQVLAKNNPSVADFGKRPVPKSHGREEEHEKSGLCRQISRSAAQAEAEGHASKKPFMLWTCLSSYLTAQLKQSIVGNVSHEVQFRREVSFYGASIVGKKLHEPYTSCLGVGRYAMSETRPTGKRKKTRGKYLLAINIEIAASPHIAATKAMAWALADLLLSIMSKAGSWCVTQTAEAVCFALKRVEGGPESESKQLSGFPACLGP
jgi:hypothetical protein